MTVERIGLASRFPYHMWCGCSSWLFRRGAAVPLYSGGGMIVIERKDVQIASESVNSNLADIFNLDQLLVESKGIRVAFAFIKGLLACAALFAFSGMPWCSHSDFMLSLTFTMSIAFLINEYVEQNLSGSHRNAPSALLQSVRGINPAFLALVPAVFLLFTMNFQCLLIAVCNMLEVVGIACGVPLLLFGMIKIGQKSNIGKTHLYVGSASAFGSVALAIAVNLIFSNVSDLSIFSATNYFSDAIAVIYAPNVVLPIDR